MGRQQRQVSSKRVRVRSKRLDQLDESKLALALWLMAKHLLEHDPAAPSSTASVPPVSEPESG